jgi:predicted 2-oxoglutarate/Fe(II)-dependent dioxygenase YbiX
MASQRALVSRGERATDFVLRRGDGQPTRFYGFVGGAPAVMVFSGGGGEGAATELVGLLRPALGPDIDVHVVAGGSEVADPRTFHDPEGAVHRAYGVSVDGDPVSVVLDPNVRVAATREHGDRDGAVAAVAAAVAAATSTDEASTARRHAPVLLVPDALDASLRARLIERWEVSGNVETGVETTVGAERTEEADQLRKRRRDHTVTDPELLRTLSSHIGRRIMPEIRKAFAYRAKRFEGFKIGCYRATDRGFFTAHRDNLSPSTAHRKFALTLNLNEDYDGGELRFPEYGPDRYRPSAGEALIFSGAHLHEVLPVTRGRRFVLLSFLFGDEAGQG